MGVESAEAILATPLRGLVARDLFRATGRAGYRAFLAALLFSPSFCAVLRFRLSVAAHRKGFGKISLLLWHSNIRRYGCHLSPFACVDAGLFLPHPVGVVLGEGVIVGRDVTLYQNVTVGRSGDGYPKLAEGATIYPNSVVFGQIELGAACTVGAGSVIRDAIAPGTTVAGNPAKCIRRPVERDA